METNPNQKLLLDEYQTDSSYQPLGPPTKSIPFNFAIDQNGPGKVNLFNFERDSNVQIYKYVIYAYLVINGFMLVKGALDLMKHSGTNWIMAVMISLISFSIWFFGSIAFTTKSARTQTNFQGLLILFMCYHVIYCCKVVWNSYTVLPNVTFSSFGLNAIYGVVVPVLIYYEADKIRQIFEGANFII